MRLADSEIAISLDNETIHLRASLRAAYRLEKHHEGFQNLSEAIALCNLGSFVDVIRESSPDPSAVDRFFGALRATSVNETISELREPFLKFVLLLAGVDQESQTAASGTPIPFEEYFASLYRIATGWLGWTPEQAWNATAPEIIEAHRGRSEMLAAIFGSKGQDNEEITVTDIASVRDQLNAIGDTNVTSMAQVP